MKHNILPDLAWGVGIVVVALIASYARKQGYIDQETMLRVVAMNGLMIAWYGNRMPKAITPSAFARQITRFAGWMFVLSGLTYAGFWAFAPIDDAVIFGTSAVAVGMVLTIIYCFWLRGRAQAKA